jgi:hypothetical protein
LLLQDVPMQNKPIRTSVAVDEKIKLPVVWIIVLSLVGVGVVIHIILWYFLGSGLVIWPFVFSICVLLIINDAAEQTGGGMPALQAYGAFFGTLIGLFLFIMLVSKTINPWILILAVIGSAFYLVRDWKQRKQKQLEINRRREAGLCVRCCEPVTDGLEDFCLNCGMPVFPERLDLFRLGRAIAMRAESRPGSARQVLTGTKPNRSDAKLQNLQNQQRAAKYNRRR